MKKFYSVSIVILLSLSFLFSFNLFNSIQQQNQDIQALNQQLDEIQQNQIELSKRLEDYQNSADQLIKQSAYKRDIPLSDELQKYTYDTCNQYGVSYDLVLNIMRVESQYTPGLISPNGDDYGLMQINKINHGWLADAGLPDLLDSRQNITAGVIILSKLQSQFDSTEGVIMAYNLGGTKARKYLAQGRTSEYVTKVLGGY